MIDQPVYAMVDVSVKGTGDVEERRALTVTRDFLQEPSIGELRTLRDTVEEMFFELYPAIANDTDPEAMVVLVEVAPVRKVGT
jgi:hypothetical protein